VKKILFVANVAKEHILKFHVPSIKAFKNEGWLVDVACSGDESIPYCDHQFHMCWKRSPFTPKTLKGIKDLTKIINEGKYDVVYCHTPVGGMVARIAARKARNKGTRVIYFSHGFHFFKGAPKLNWIIYYPVERILARWTDKMITINAEDCENAKKILKCKDVMQLDGMGIDIDLFTSTDVSNERARIRNELGIPQGAWVMIYLAELIPNKNQKMLLDALKLVMEKHPETYLIIAGVDHYQGEIQQYAQDIRVEKNFRYLGWRSDKEALYASADICTPTSIREGFGLNLVEAMAMGLPVVATRNRGHETIIRDGDNGYLVEIGDSLTMANRIFSVMADGVPHKLDTEELKKYDQHEIIKRIINYVST